MFGLKYLRNYVGEISWFERLPSMTETELHSEVSVGTTEGRSVSPAASEDGLLAHQPNLSFVTWAIRRNPFKSKHQSKARRDPRLESVLPMLRKKCQALCTGNGATRRYVDEMRETEREVKCISRTLTAGLFQHIGATFFNAYMGHEYSDTNQSSHVDYDRQVNTRAMMEELRVLRAKFDVTEDDDEQRALEEDVAGKILWLCWCGICAEVDQILPEVVSYIREEGNLLDHA
ncbi:hypothetical protein F5J12DRAFT_55107 [Pisolithus orientalis]|uniref:uncharacterized protein n=1 Tax=Pisolithus orientalis TaxID=936130 RepID=UPI00222410FA|nr:uncharacterized protein F5J12DRAFT_55107 [Pisolithus orientalis]KAI6008831.1 hypothetical protein F5J12DRAFT_55107 [Pisolithus orientalis]